MPSRAWWLPAVQLLRVQHAGTQQHAAAREEEGYSRQLQAAQLLSRYSQAMSEHAAGVRHDGRGAATPLQRAARRCRPAKRRHNVRAAACAASTALSAVAAASGTSWVPAQAGMAVRRPAPHALQAGALQHAATAAACQSTTLRAGACTTRALRSSERAANPAAACSRGAKSGSAARPSRTLRGAHSAHALAIPYHQLAECAPPQASSPAGPRVALRASAKMPHFGAAAPALPAPQLA